MTKAMVNKDFCGIINNVCDFSGINCGRCTSFVDFVNVFKNGEPETVTQVKNNMKEELNMKEVVRPEGIVGVDVVMVEDIRKSLCSLKKEDLKALTFSLLDEIQGLLCDVNELKKSALDNVALVNAKAQVLEVNKKNAELKKNLADFTTVVLEQSATIKALEAALNITCNKEVAKIAQAKTTVFALLSQEDQKLVSAYRARRIGRPVTVDSKRTAEVQKPQLHTDRAWMNTSTSFILSKKAEEDALCVDVACTKCGQFNVKPNVGNYSLRKYGVVACRACQSKLTAVNPNTRTNTRANTSASNQAPAQNQAVNAGFNPSDDIPL